MIFFTAYIAAASSPLFFVSFEISCCRCRFSPDAAAIISLFFRCHVVAATFDILHYSLIISIFDAFSC